MSSTVPKSSNSETMMAEWSWVAAELLTSVPNTAISCDAFTLTPNLLV